MTFDLATCWKGIKIIAKVLAILSFLFVGRPINGQASPSAQGGTYPLGQNSAPGSVVRFERLTIQDGLSQNAGLTVFQDSRGFLWFGTQDGLNRYDGYSFTVFRHDDEDSTTISHNSILSIAEDEDGFLWVGTWGGGLNRFDPVSETFTSYQNDPQNPASLSNNIVTSILQDADGNIWVGTLGGLDRYDPDIDGFEHFRYVYGDATSLSSNVISVIFEDSRRQLWIGTGALGSPGTGLNRFNPSTGRAMRFQHNDADPTSLASDNISAIYEAPDGNFWIGTGGYGLTGDGLELFNPRTGTAFHYLFDSKITDSISGNNISAIWGDPTGLWVGTRSNGLNRMDFSNVGHFVRYEHDPYFPDSLGDDEVWSLFKDNSGILWIGTADQGISKLPANTGQFSLYRNNPSKPSSLGTNIVGAFSEDKYGYIWIGTWGGGLDRFDPRRGDFEHFRNDPADPVSLSSDMVMTVYADPQNVVWVGTLGGGLNRMDLATGQITHYVHNPRDPASLPNDNVAVIIPDGEGGLWLGTYGGLAHYDPETDSFTNYINTQPGNPNNLAYLSENRVVSLYLDNAEGLLWIGTWGGGLNRLNLNSPLHALPRFALFKTYRYNSNDPGSLSEDSVWAIQKTADGYLWLGTQSGLNRFNPETQTFERYSQKQGLPNDSVMGILKDEQGYLWLTTANGLAKFDRRQETFTTYDVTDGLQSNVFNSNAYFRSVSGTMYIGGVNGFNTFIPNKVQPNPVYPKVAVTRFEVLNEPAALDLTGQTPIKLSYQQNFITFEFAALDFSAPQQNHYAYMLEGFDQNWIQTEDRRFATYTNLPGGQYVFRLKASNSDGIWNEDGIAIPVIVSPPIWQTIWFQGSAVLLLIGLLVFGVRWRLRTISAQKAALENQVAIRTSELLYEIEQREKAEQALAEKAAQDAVAEDRTRLARDLHDAVTQTLFSASMIAEVLPEIWSGSQAEGRKRLDELRQLTRGALAEMRTLLVELRPSGLTDIPLPELLRQLCDSLVGRARLPIQLHTDRIPKLPPELQVCLYRITQEALNNIIKHARATQVLVTLRADDKVTLSIIDNGCGFDPASITPEHLGLKIMCERAETIGAEFSVYSEPGEGTQIVVSWAPAIPARLITSDNQQISPERDDELTGMEIEN